MNKRNESVLTVYLQGKFCIFPDENDALDTLSLREVAEKISRIFSPNYIHEVNLMPCVYHFFRASSSTMEVLSIRTQTASRMFTLHGATQ
jgi:hypothetical protein